MTVLHQLFQFMRVLVVLHIHFLVVHLIVADVHLLFVIFKTSDALSPVGLSMLVPFSNASMLTRVLVISHLDYYNKLQG